MITLHTAPHRSVASVSLALLGLGLLALPAPAATLVSYTFPSGSNATSASDPNVTPSVISSNIGTVGTDSGFSGSASNAFVRVNATDSTQAGALSGNDYFSFTLTPQGGYSVDLTSFSLTMGNQSGLGLSFTSAIFVRTSLDGYASDVAITSTTGATTFSGGVASRTTTTNSTLATDSVVFTVSGAEFQDITGPVTFRIYTYDTGVGAAPDSNQSITRFDNVIVQGNVSVVPEPSSFALLGIACATAFLNSRRRRKA